MALLSSEQEQDGEDESTSPLSQEASIKKAPAVDPAANVLANPELAALGRPLKSNAPVELTEEELEYTVI